MKFNKYLRKLRKDKKLGQLDLAALSGVSKSHISRMEIEDVAPKPETLRKLAPVLGVSYEHLMEKAGYMTEVDLAEVSKVKFKGKELSEFELEWIIAFLETSRRGKNE